MSFMSRLPRPQAMTSQDLEKLIRSTFGGGMTASGVNVTPDSAMRLITVQNCVRMRATTLQRLPCHIMEAREKSREKAEGFYLYDILLHQPNSWMTAPEFWGMAEALVSLHGDFVCYKAQIPGRPIRELIPINPSLIRKIEQKPDFSIDYEIQFPNGDVKHLNQEQVFHLRPLTLNGFTGLGSVAYAREAIGKGLASERHLSRWFSKGLHPSAVIRHPLSLNSPEHAKLRENLKEKYEGLGKNHEFMLIDEAMEIDFPQIKLVDAQFLEQMKLNEAQICGMFRVPQMLVCAGDKAPTYASSEQFMLFYQMFSIDTAAYESAIRRDLLTPEERRKYYAKFNVNALLKGDYKTRMEGYQIAINSEILSPNEARGLEDMNPYEGGDVYRTRTSTTNRPASNSSKNSSEATQ